ncbi:MAG: family 43 glycosylhydrolase [Bacteroidota bacterium]|nr:family 43 glycosylhydrolase [Bacteroidota bacterium]
MPLPSGIVTKNVTLHDPVLDADFPDPTVINADGNYYAYSTQGRHDGKMNNIQVTSSKDLFNWKYEGDALLQKPPWASNTQSFWTPDVLYDL